MDHFAADPPYDDGQTSAPEPETASSGTEARLTLRLICTSDLHMQLHCTGQDCAPASQGCGLAGLADVIATARAEVPNTLLLDNGDTFQGSLEADFMIEATGEPHPMIAAMNRLGFDAATLGNHDFDYGLPFLTQTLPDARFPVVLSNLEPGTGLAQVVQRIGLLTRNLRDAHGAFHVVRIGIVGLAPPDVTAPRGTGDRLRVTTPDPGPAAEAAAAALRAEGADLLVLLYHGGFESEPERHAGDVRRLVRLTRADAVVMGHQHQLYPTPDHDGAAVDGGRLGGIPAVMPGYRGSHLGVMDLDLERRGTRWQVSAGRAALRPNRRQSGATPGARFVASLSRRVTRTAEASLDRLVGTVSGPFHSFFALAHSDRSVRLAAQASLDALDAALDGSPEAALPRLATATSYRVGGRGGPANFLSVPDGALRERHVRDIHPFQNRLCAVTVTGADLRAWLEASCAIFSRIDPAGPPALLVRRDARSYRFDTILGLTYGIDLSAPAGARLTRLCHAGAPVTPADRFVLATTDFRRHTPPRGVGPLSALPVGPRPDMQSVLRDWLARQSPVDPATLPPVWQFEPLGGAQIVIETHPHAERHLGDLAPAAPRVLTQTRDGFLRVQLTL